MNSSYDLLLFDLDGTLSDPFEGISRSFTYALAHFGYPPVSASEAGLYIGPPLDHGFRSITGITSKATLSEMVAKYRERYADVGYSENVLYAGVPEMIQRLEELGFPLAVCTSKRKDFAERILEMFGLRDHFRFVSGGDVGIPKWRQMESLLAEGTVTPSTLMIGDRAIDLVAAHRNGLESAAVLWGYGSREELMDEKPRYVFSAPDELPGLENQLSGAGQPIC